MADSKPLLSLEWDPVAAEALLRDVFGIVVDEVVWKGTSASEKVGPFSLFFLPINLAQNFAPPTRLFFRLLPLCSSGIMYWVLLCYFPLFIAALKIFLTCCFKCMLVVPCVY